MSEEELHFFQRHLVSLIQIKKFADTFDQLCFQMERLWFYLFKRSSGDASLWFGECSEKTLDIQAFEKARRDLAESAEAGGVKYSNVEKLLSLSSVVQECYKSLKRASISGAGYSHLISEGEEHSLSLSRLIFAIFCDMQKSYV